MPHPTHTGPRITYITCLRAAGFLEARQLAHEAICLDLEPPDAAEIEAEIEAAEGEGEGQGEG